MFQRPTQRPKIQVVSLTQQRDHVWPTTTVEEHDPWPPVVQRRLYICRYNDELTTRSHWIPPLCSPKQRRLLPTRGMGLAIAHSEDEEEDDFLCDEVLD